MVKKEKEKIEEITSCPKCWGEHISKDYSRAELICKDCGLVIDEDIIDHGPEWCAFDSDQREIADIAGVTEVTIRNRYKEMAKKLDLSIYL